MGFGGWTAWVSQMPHRRHVMDESIIPEVELCWHHASVEAPAAQERHIRVIFISNCDM